jgi:hypothetical protein
VFKIRPVPNGRRSDGADAVFRDAGEGERDAGFLQLKSSLLQAPWAKSDLALVQLMRNLTKAFYMQNLQGWCSRHRRPSSYRSAGHPATRELG